MRKTITALPACLAILSGLFLLATCLAQDETEAKPAEELEDEALRSLLGESAQPAEEPAEEPARPAREAGTRTPTRETERERDRDEGERPAPDRESATRRPVERAEETERESARPAPDDTAVPVVPPSADDALPPERDDLLRTEEPHADDGAEIPLTDYRNPTATSTDTLDETSPTTETSPAESLAPAAPKGMSPASTIVISLIILAVLLVALAAIVGIMAAQRANRMMAIPPATAAAHDVWAYLSAPDVPDIPIQQRSFVMGSDTNCDLRLADPKASPNHARIDETDDGWVLTDLRSTNGTYLNGERIASPVALRQGDEIQMGDIIVTFNVYE